MIDLLRVTGASDGTHHGLVSADHHPFRIPCAIGRGGFVREKCEGDGATPIGNWPLRRVFYRPDRLAPPVTTLPVFPIAPDDGWCDDPDHSLYNQLVKKPFAARHEDMWRDDTRYDLVVVLGHNDNPVVPHAGSAIFWHLARPDWRATAGCVAVCRESMLWLLAQCHPGTVMAVEG